MNGEFGSELDVLGERLGRAINHDLVGTAGQFYYSGYLVTNAGDNFVDEAGNKFVYVERQNIQ